MNEPLPGQKTNLVAAVFTLVQGAAVAGFIDPSMAEGLSQVFAGLFAVTLALKGLRHAKGA